MAWNLDSSRPIYAQIAEQVRLDIVSGLYQPGTKLPSVRELASQAKVNPNTMQKALAELERSGLVHSKRTSLMFGLLMCGKQVIRLRKAKLFCA